MIGSKSALTVGSLATAMLFGGGLYLYMNFGSLAKTLAEKVATQTLGVDVNVGAVQVFLKDKKVEVRNVAIANPPGYKNAKAMTIGTISIQAQSLSQELLNFANATMTDMHVNLEVTPKGTNLTDIRNNIKVPGREAQAAEDRKTITKVILREFAAEGGTITPSISMLQTQPKPINVPPIHLSGIGEAENGVLAGQAVAQIFRAVANESIKAAHEQNLLDGVDGALLKDMGVGEIQQLKETIKDEAGAIGDKVKGLFE